MLIGTSRDQTEHISLSSHRMHLHDFVDFAGSPFVEVLFFRIAREVVTLLSAPTKIVSPQLSIRLAKTDIDVRKHTFNDHRTCDATQ